MFNALRISNHHALKTATRTFSTSQRVASDVAKLTLVGRLSHDAESRLTKNEKPYVKYTVVTSSSILTPDGERQYVPSFHRILSFRPETIDFLSKLKKGTRVFVQADYSIKEADPSADPATFQGQKQVSLVHESLKILSMPRATEPELSETFKQTESSL